MICVQRRSCWASWGSGMHIGVWYMLGPFAKHCEFNTKQQKRKKKKEEKLTSLLKSPLTISVPISKGKGTLTSILRARGHPSSSVRTHSTTTCAIILSQILNKAHPAILSSRNRILLCRLPPGRPFSPCAFKITDTKGSSMSNARNAADGTT